MSTSLNFWPFKTTKHFRIVKRGSGYLGQYRYLWIFWVNLTILYSYPESAERYIHDHFDKPKVVKYINI